MDESASSVEQQVLQAEDQDSEAAYQGHAKRFRGF